MIRFLHAADFHLDAPFASLPPELAAMRRREQRELVAELAAAANAHACDVLLLAGDLFDSVNAYPETMEAIARAFSACRARVFISPGNHDCLLPGSPYLTASWPEQVHIFRTARMSAARLPELGVCVWGAGFRSTRAAGLLEGFRAPQDGLQHIMALHGDAADRASVYNAVTPEQIAASGLSYLALGHLHAASGLMRAGGTYYAWPGCLSGRGFDECGQKGAYLGELDGQGRVKLTFLPLGSRRYEIRRVEAGEDPAAAIEAALPEDARRDIFRIVLTGQAEAIDLRALQDRFSSRVFSLDLRDETHPPRSLWAGAGEDTLRGLFLARLRAQYDAADSDQQRRRIALAARLGTAAMDGREDAF